jgi:hypothetical protein
LSFRLSRLAAGCLVGEVTGMAIATALGLGATWPRLSRLSRLQFFFDYSLTSLALLRARLAFAAIVPIALAADTVSIAIMELIDNLTIVLPGGVGGGSRGCPLLGTAARRLPHRVAFFAFAVNRAMIRRGKGHAVAHEYHGH